METTLAEKESKRWAARQDADAHASFPQSLELNGVLIPLYKYSELEMLSRARIKERALNLRDIINSTKSRFFEHHPELRLNANAFNVASWIIDVQVVLAAAIGSDDLTHAAFGAPAKEDYSAATPMPTQQQVARDAPCWSQHGVAGVDDGYVPIRKRSPLGSRSVAKYNGFSLVPPQFENCSRGHDAVNIRRLHESTGIVLG